MARKLLTQGLLLVTTLAGLATCLTIAQSPALFVTASPVGDLLGRLALSLLPWLVAGLLTGLCLAGYVTALPRPFLFLVNGLTALALLLLLALPLIFLKTSPEAFFAPLPVLPAPDVLLAMGAYLVFVCALVDTLQVLARRQKNRHNDSMTP